MKDLKVVEEWYRKEVFNNKEAYPKLYSLEIAKNKLRFEEEKR